MAPPVVSLHAMVVRNAKAFKAAWRQAAKHIQDQLPAAVRPTQAELQPILVRNAPRHALHHLAAIKQSKGRWYTTHSAISATVRRFTSKASGVKYDRSSFPTSRIGTLVNNQTGRAPFASTLRPNLTGGTLGRTAGGYGWGSGRAGGARYFSHGPAAPAQVINNVSQAVRAFLISGQKAQFDGISPHTGEKRFKTVTALQDQVARKVNKIPKASPGSYIAFPINPTITALTPLNAVVGFPSHSHKQTQTLHTDGLLDVLSIDFSRAVKDLAATLADLQRLSALGDLPLSYADSVLRVHFPGCDAGTVERLCAEFEVSRGVVRQDPGFDAFVGSEIALLFPLAPSRAASECSFFDTPATKTQQEKIDWQHMLSPAASGFGDDAYSTLSETSDDQFVDVVTEENPWLGSEGSLIEGYESGESGEHTPLEYQGVEGMYRFLSQCEAR